MKHGTAAAVYLVMTRVREPLIQFAGGEQEEGQKDRRVTLEKKQGIYEDGKIR
jgi:hypothetical protein